MRFAFLSSALALISSFSLNVNFASASKDWVIIAVGSNGYDNYRHHADGCHAYHIASDWGVPDENIITMIYDDVAQSKMNPYPGQLFNQPTNKGEPGVDVYAGCQKDYVGGNVTAANFLKVLVGDESAGGKVLKSTEEDNVFINFIDHGAPGLVAFPAGPYLYANDLIATLKEMSTKKMFNKLVFYMEACESGSMFENLLPEDINIYVTTASNSVESSWGTYCSPDDKVNGKSVGSCLGDLYSVNWMQNSESAGQTETLDDQFQIVVNETTLSHVMKFGDFDFIQDKIGEFEGNLGATPSVLFHKKHHSKKSTSFRPSTSNVDARDISLHNAYHAYIQASSSSIPTVGLTDAYDRLQSVLDTRMKTDVFFSSLISKSTASNDEDISHFYTSPSSAAIAQCDTCCKSIEESIRESCTNGQGLSDYGIKYMSVVHNLCDSINQNHDATQQIVKNVQQLCSSNNYQLQNVQF